MATVSEPIGINSVNKYPNLDTRYGPYASTTLANERIASNKRTAGLTVGIEIDGTIVEYWYQPNEQNQLVLVPKQAEVPEQVQSDWAESDQSNPAYIKNKPTISDGGQGSTAITLSGNVKVTASTASGETAGVSVTPGQNAGEIEMSFTLPKGDTGDTGEQGPAGPQGIQGKSAYQVWLDDNGWTAEQHPVSEYINSLKAHVSVFVPVAYDATAAGTSVGQTFNFVLSNPIDGSMVIMPNAGSGATGSIMFAVSVNNGTATYTRVGDVDIDTSNFITKDKITRTLANIGSENVLSARLGAQILKDMILHADNEDFMQLLDAADSFSGYISTNTLKFTNSANATYKIIPVDDVAIIKVKGNSINKCQLFFLKEWTGVYAANDDAPLVDFQNYAISVNTDEEVTIPVVADAKFLYIRTTNTDGEDTTPVSLKLTGRNAATEQTTQINLSPANKSYVRPTGDSKNTWHSSTNYARAITTSEANRGSILRVTANAENASYIAVLADATVDSNRRAIFAQAYGSNTKYGGTVTIPAGQTVELYIPDDTAAVIFYFGAANATTYAPQSVVRVTLGIKSIEDTITRTIADSIDTTIPDTPSDSRIPSTALLAENIQTISQQIPSIDKFTSLKNVEIKNGTVRFIGFNDESTSNRAGKWYVSEINSWLKSVEPGEEYLVTASLDGRAGISFLTNGTKGGSGDTPAWATGYSKVVEIPAGESQSFIVPSNAVVMYVYMANGIGTHNSRGAAPQKIEQRISVSSAIGEINDRIDNINEEISKGTGILDLYPDSMMLPKFKQLRNNDYGNDTKPIANCFTFAHISDCHGGSATSGAATNQTAHANWLRFITFVKHWYDNGYLDDVVDTGDIVANKQANLLNEWRYDPDNFTLNIKVCIGNHDIANQGSSGSESTETDETTRINLPAFNKFIAPCVETWSEEGVIFPTNAATQGKCYYYKDYARTSDDRNVTLRAIYLDFMGWGKNTNTGDTPAAADAQKTWLESVLSDAITNDYMVCIFIHFAPLGVKKINCSFSSVSANALNEQSQYNSYIYELASVVYQFQEQGGRFVGYIVGHVHRTFVGQLTGTVTDINNNTINLDDAPYQQIVFATDNASMGLSTDFSAHDGLRSPNSISHDSFWVIAINTSGNVKIMKVGFNLNKYMQKRDTIMIRTGSYEVFDETKTNYTKGTVVTKSGLLWKIINPVVVPSYTDWLLTGKIKYVRPNGDETTYQEFNSATIYTADDIVTKDGELWKLTVPYVVSAHTDWAASDKEPYSRVISD